MTGIVRGKTIELDQDPGIPDGEVVEVQMQVKVKTTPSPQTDQEVRSARDAMTEADWDAWEMAMQQIYQARKLPRRHQGNME